MGLQGKGEIGAAPEKQKGISPCPCTINVEAWREWSWTGGVAVVKQPRSIAAGNVEMVADEVCQ